MKEKIIELIEQQSTDYWIKFPNEYSHVAEESPEAKFIEEQNDKLAEDIINLFEK